MSDEGQRYSKPFEVELVKEPEGRARLEAKNGLRQFDEVIEQVEHWLRTGREFKLRPSAILSLHRKALEGISAFAGLYRPAAIEIQGSSHKPPDAQLVPSQVEELCDYVNEHPEKSPIHSAAYSLWRLNWIHPFVDGNGRTSRAVSYLVLCVRLGYRLPGTNTIPEQISRDKSPYYGALEAADRASEGGRIDVGELESLLQSLLANQLAFLLNAAKAETKST